MTLATVHTRMNAGNTKMASWFRYVSAAVAVFAAIGGVAFAQDAERPAVGPEWPFRVAPRVEQTLPNGLRVIVTRQTVVPKVSIRLTVLSGLASDPAALPGVAALTAEAIQEGTRTRSSRQIREAAFGMGASLSASASQDFTAVELRGLAEFTPALLDLLADVVANPTFPADEIAILKGQRLQRLMQENASPQFVSNREFRRALFGDHPYARVTSTPQAIQTIDRDKLARFHEIHYRPNNAFLLVVGDVQPEQVFAAARTSFGAWPRGDVEKAAAAPPPPLSGRHVIFVQRPNSVQSSITVGNLAVKRSDPKYFELSVANTIYGGAFNSRIVRNIREEKGYTYSPQSQFAAFGDAGFYRFAADVRNEVTGPTLTEVFKEIATLRADGSRGDELNGAKSYMRGLFAIQTATQNGLAGTLNTVYVYALPKDYTETYRSRIAAIDPEQVKEGASKLLGDDDTVVVIVGDWTKVKEQLAGYKDITFLDVEGKKLSAPPTDD